MRFHEMTPLLALGLANCAPAPTAPDERSIPGRPVFYVDGSSTTCGGTGTNNSNTAGIDRTCLTNGNVVLTHSGAGSADLAAAIAS